ncbi:MAG: DUF3575 domain-containing protein [Croceitalea sp.]|nr:DUF3575 domain-containing protein [Croceitalea sp.]MBT8238803.1 DUF3575 domain-containing protein [Croceitalea sp.]NNC34220.1 DUF3575 domain-containing protein [Croceitalea sp.]NNL10076.1 DUF3575 domain-containing protein [Croceitalea sp.]NNM19356.1 DUF3575 domain-containing protein [Croceitalea sp.]
MKYLSILIVFFLGTLVHAQDEILDDGLDRNELKLNASNLIAFEFLDGSYEYLINEESSIGFGILVNIGDDDVLDEYRTFSFTPFYRQFFSKKYAKGFFVEAFGMFNTGKDEYSDFIYDPYYESNEGTKYTDFALGISVGGKFVTKRGFVAEIYAGIGRNLMNGENAPEVVGRGGVSLGYRF